MIPSVDKVVSDQQVNNYFTLKIKICVILILYKLRKILYNDIIA